MRSLALIDALDEPFEVEPRFTVEAPDGRKLIPELPRQTTFLGMMRIGAPSVEVRALPNAGKRNPDQAKKEGIKAGLFDLGVWWNRGHAVLEFKGYDKRGRAGTLSDAQVRFGNRLHDQGHHVACFFTPEAAIDWLRSIGAPIVLRVSA